ncbi:MAG: hypothetical protein P0Y60_03855 [Candidatus Microbacterium colombiense]|nr:MAG: hypothetical protein P0Y60_03855 [Microbacterium sp.]
MMIMLGFGLTACDDVPSHGDFEMGFDGSKILIGSCFRASVTEVSVSEYVREPGESSSRRVWEAAGETELKVGEPLVVGGDNLGLRNDLFIDPAPRPGIQYNVLFNDVPQLPEIGEPRAWFELNA